MKTKTRIHTRWIAAVSLSAIAFAPTAGVAAVTGGDAALKTDVQTNADSGSGVSTSTKTDAKADAAITAQAKELDHMSAESKKGEQAVRARLSERFAALAGSRENAEALIDGMRNGEKVELKGSGAGAAGATVSFTPTKEKLGYGEIFITLALAQRELIDAGIEQATPSDIRAALIGGDVARVGADGKAFGAAEAELSGVLTLREKGMGWGRIARQQGENLGNVISDIKRTESGAAADLHGRAEVDANMRGTEQANASVNGALNSTVERPADVIRPDTPDQAQRPDLPDDTLDGSVRPNLPDRPMDQAAQPEQHGRPLDLNLPVRAGK